MILPSAVTARSPHTPSAKTLHSFPEDSQPSATPQPPRSHRTAAGEKELAAAATGSHTHTITAHNDRNNTHAHTHTRTTPFGVLPEVGWPARAPLSSRQHGSSSNNTAFTGTRADRSTAQKNSSTKTTTKIENRSQLMELMAGRFAGVIISPRTLLSRNPPAHQLTHLKIDLNPALSTPNINQIPLQISFKSPNQLRRAKRKFEIFFSVLCFVFSTALFLIVAVFEVQKHSWAWPGEVRRGRSCV